MKRFLVFVLVLFLPFYSAHADELSDKIEEILSFHIEKEYNVGAVVGVLEGGKTDVWAQGTVKLGESIPPNDQTIFEIGSISKVFTGILLADLVLDGVVSFDDPISKFVPELESAKTGSITLLELSTHTSGLPRIPTNFSPANPKDPYADYTEEKLLEFLKDHPLGDHPIPFSWDNYSNVGVGLLGYALTRATGLRYEELLYNRITEPLGMMDTVVSLNPDQTSRFATPYNGFLEEILPWNINVLVGAGGIRSTATDLLKFAQANLEPQKTLIASALELAQQVHKQNGKDRIGLGWGIWDKENFVIHGHGGATGGFLSYIGFDLNRKVALVYLTNTFSQLTCLKEVALYGKECTTELEADVPEKILEEYVGTYKEPSGIEIIITRRKKYLIYEIVGQEKNRMKALSNSSFDIFGKATIEFVRGEDGNVTHFILKQGSYTGKFERL
ncbi:serine hydrolase [Bdellovibrionota bacterium]